jgi:ubiquinone/menaquinone biosynthesis C-methylase UbiE
MGRENDSQRTPEEVRGVYEHIADEYDQRLASDKLLDRRFMETEEAFVLSKVNPSDEVLDLACGTGRLTIPLAKKCKRVTGSDISASMLARARVKAEEQGLDIEFHEGSMTKLPFADESFDVITSMLALMHIRPEERLQVFGEAARVLRPGGRMITGVKNSVFERFCKADRFLAKDKTVIEQQELVFTENTSGTDLTIPWYSFSPQELSSLFLQVGMGVAHLKGLMPLTAWLADGVLEDPQVYRTANMLEELFSDIPPINHLGYYLLVEAVKLGVRRGE